MSRVYLIAGASGMLGTALQRVVEERGERCLAPRESEFDITDAEAVRVSVARLLAELGEADRGVLINCAAYTNVEAAEADEAKALLVNEAGARILAEAAKAASVAFVHVSTDFVFDGRKEGAYAEDDAVNPLSVYGASKLAGERAVATVDPGALQVRTAWVFGANGVNFPTKILAAARERGALSVVDDEIGSPTYTTDLARGILGLLDKQAPAGMYHLAGSGSASRYDLAEEVVRLAGLDVALTRAKSADFASAVTRPANSVLDCSKARRLGVVMPEWRDALERFMHETGELSA